MYTKYKCVPFCPYNFVHTILSNTIFPVYHLSIPFCPILFCPYTICPYHSVQYYFARIGLPFVHTILSNTILPVYHLSIPFCPILFCPYTICPYHSVQYYFVQFPSQAFSFLRSFLRLNKTRG